VGSDGLESAGSPGLVQLYTLRTHTVVRTLTFTSRVLSVRASPRLLIVALDAQACPPKRPHLSTLSCMFPDLMKQCPW